MKRSSMYLPTLFIASSTILLSCEKTDLVPDNSNTVKSAKSACEALAFRSNFGAGTQYVFKKLLDPATGQLQQLTAAAYQGGAISTTTTFDVHWTANSVAFLKAGTTTDTVLVASLSAEGKPVSVVAGNTPDALNYLPTSFEYVSNRLSAMKITLGSSQLVSRFNYDTKGNCVLIQDDAQGTITPGRVEYTYDNKKADQQVYFDEPRGFSWNTFSLMQFAGLLPELQPTTLRTGVKVFWANNYKAYDVSLGNHQVQGGTLQSYEVTTFNGSPSSLPYFTDWQCGGAQ
ncbi:MAG TPA: hypothetical protein VFZ47_07745 [Chitinophagaceae bacterium]